MTSAAPGLRSLRRPPPLAIAGVLAGASLLAPGMSRADCTTSADCSEGHECQDGTCVGTVGAPPPPSPTGTAPTGLEPDERGRRAASNFLLTAGLGAIGSGYILAAGGAGIASISKGSEDSKYGGSCDDSAPLSFIPLVGPILTLAQYPNHQVVGYGTGSPTVLDCASARTPATVLVVIDEVIQLGGVGMVLAGLITRATLHASATTSIEVLPGAVGAPLGLTVHVAHF